MGTSLSASKAKAAKTFAALDPLLKPETGSIMKYFDYLNSMLSNAMDQAKDTQAELIKRFEPKIAYKLMCESLSLDQVKAGFTHTRSVEKFFETPEVMEYCKNRETASAEEVNESKKAEIELIKRFGPSIADGLVRDALTFENVKRLAGDPKYAARVSKFFQNPKVKEYYQYLDDDYKIRYGNS